MVSCLPGRQSVTDRLTHVALVFVGALTWPATLVAGEVGRIAVTVRIYQRADLAERLDERALTEASSVLRAANVDVVWKDCSAPNPAPACDAPPGSSEVVLRILAEGVPAESKFLGTALVERPSGGRFATVYTSHVARIARSAGVDVAVLLGRVAAHELGHLIMNTSEHTRHGLMRPNWTAREIRQNRVADWVFTAADTAAMRPPAGTVDATACR